MRMMTAVCNVKGTGPIGMVNRHDRASNAMSRPQVTMVFVEVLDMGSLLERIVTQ